MTNFIRTKKVIRLNFAVCLIFCVCGISACSNDDSDSQNSGVYVLQEINYSIIHEGSDGALSDGTATSGIEKEYATLLNQQDYETKLGEFSRDSPLTVDFSTQRILFLSMGEQTTGGFAIEATRIEEFSDGLVATVVLSSPGEGCIVTQAFTNPYKFIQITSLDDDIQVSEKNVVVDCT